MKAIKFFSVVMATVLAPLPTALAGDGHGQKDGDINIGVTSGGQIVVEWSGELVGLPELAGPLFGFGLDEPGFFSIQEDEPDEDIFVLGAGANIVLEVLSFDDALQGWRPGFSGVFDDFGETWNIGACRSTRIRSGISTRPIRCSSLHRDKRSGRPCFDCSTPAQQVTRRADLSR